MQPISSSTTREGGLLPPAPGSWCRVVRRREEHAKNNLPDLLIRWRRRDGSGQPFTVSKAEIPARGYDLSLNRLTTKRWSTGLRRASCGTCNASARRSRRERRS
ncbi:hypothetical protein GCM10010289_69750 [Streptomyces violascens]|nr:hypothetical protein GCM10010289_69750 [Streptomyces violascens]